MNGAAMIKHNQAMELMVRASSAARRGMHWLAATEARKAINAWQDAIAAAEAAMLIESELASEKQLDGIPTFLRRQAE